MCKQERKIWICRHFCCCALTHCDSSLKLNMSNSEPFLTMVDCQSPSCHNGLTVKAQQQKWRQIQIFRSCWDTFSNVTMNSSTSNSAVNQFCDCFNRTNRGNKLLKWYNHTSHSAFIISSNISDYLKPD